ncbi:hypothetical protein Htur_1914 [Haloterrigena turkmenica DSM 5511]|uniref:Uncharacterized protein n=2 Tax=Haloterrigena turkmenica TaxID=62320 RepID=D2RSM3_HALTV|nr:hypothetical protein Htur_1914 [Haloterrigena turkmenica DSM 5511]
MTTGTTRGKSLEQWSPTAFLVAGASLVVFAALLGYEALTDISAPEDIFGPPGFFLAMVGLLGIYPALADRVPRLARVSAAGAAVAAVGWLLITVFALIEAAGILPALEEIGAFGGAIILLSGVAMILAYVGTGVASLRTGIHSRYLGLLLLAPPAVFCVMLVQAALFAQFGLFSEARMAWSAVVLSGGQALAHVGIGYLLRNESDPAGRVEPLPDTPV